jgi:phage baseplate assembly protein gpV
MAQVQPKMLVESLLEGVADHKKDSMRVILENEAKYAETLNEATFSGAIKSVPKLIMPLARRVMTNVVADQLVGVQPLKERTGICMSLKYVYASDSVIDLGDANIANAEAARYNALVQNDPDAPKATVDGSKVTYPAGAEVSYVAGVNQYASKMATEDGEKMTLNTVANPTYNEFKETTLKFTQTTVTAKTRKLAAQWSLEAAQDAQASLGINIEKEMITALAQTIANDIDRELLQTIEGKVGYTANYDYSNVSGTNSMAEKYQALYTKILEVSNQIAVRTRRGAANWMIVNPNVLTILQTLKSFNFAPSASSYVDPTNIGLAGTIEGRFKVFTDIIRTSDDVLMGYKGNTETDTGIVYMPYVPLEVSPTILDGNSFMPRVMLSTRYGIADNMMGADAYYGKVSVNLG